MKFYKLLTYDLRNGFRLGMTKLFIVLLLVIAFCVDFYLQKRSVYFFDAITPSGTWIDYLFYFHAGIKEYIPSLTDEFIFPAKWLLLHLFILYSTLYYPDRDLSSMGLNILVRTKGRVAWWVSKTIWSVCYVFACYLIIFLFVYLFGLVVDEPISLEITPIFINDLLRADSPFDTFSSNLVPIIILLPLLVSIALNLLQMTCSLFIKPIYSFGLMGVILLASAYNMHPLLIGNYAMPIRSEYVVENGFQASTGIILSVVIMFFSFIVGSIYFKRYDILHEE